MHNSNKSDCIYSKPLWRNDISNKCIMQVSVITLQRRYNERDGVAMKYS